MTAQERIESASKFGHSLKELLVDDFVLQQAEKENPWFTPGFIRNAINNLIPWFENNRLEEFASSYDLENPKYERVGLITAGNVPMVGFHDLLMAILSGSKVSVKLSSKDRILIPALLQKTGDGSLRDQVDLSGNFEEINFLLFTGSDNTARYIEHSFREVPKIMRQNRFSAAVLNGNESDLNGLAEDILLYHGMGCRSVSNLIVPPEWNHETLQDALSNFPERQIAADFKESVLYQRATYDVLGTEFAQCGPVNLIFNEGLFGVAPGTLNVVRSNEIDSILNANADKLQCIVGEGRQISFGQTQKPGLEDFADGIDVLAQLTNGPIT